MSAIFCCMLVITAHLVIGILLPGFFLELRLSRSQKLPQEQSAVLVRIIALGALYLLVQFLLLQLASRYLGIPRLSLVAAKYIVDLCVLASLVTIWRADTRSFAVQLLVSLKNPWHASLVGGAVVLGLLAMAGFPYAMDSSPIGWTAHYLADPSLAVTSSYGSPTYIALIYYPGQILDSWYPIPTVAAGLKPALCLLTVLAIVRVVNHLPFQQRGWIYWIYFLIAASSFYGIYGLQMTGKHSVFGVAMMMCFVAELFLTRERNQICATQAGLALSAAMGLGVISVPYLIVIAAVFLVLAAGRIQPFQVAFTLLVWSGLPLALNLSSIVKIPVWQSALVVTAAAGGCFALRDRVTGERIASIASRPWFRFVPVAVLLSLWLALHFIMPITFFNSRRPLDGETTFTDLLFDFEGRIPDRVVWWGLAGALLSCIVPKFSRNPGLQAFALFPFLTLLPALIVAQHFPTYLPFHPQLFWDLVKDVPNWCYGFYFGLFAVIAIEMLVGLVRRLQGALLKIDHPVLDRFLLGHVILAWSLIVAFNAAKKEWTRGPHWWGRPVYYTRVGGHKDPLFAALVERFRREEYPAQGPGSNASRSQPIYVSLNSSVNGFVNNFNMYGISVNNDVNLSDSEQWEQISNNLPARILARRDELTSFLDFGGRSFAIEEVERITESESVFLAYPDDRKRSTIRFADAANVLLPDSAVK